MSSLLEGLKCNHTVETEQVRVFYLVTIGLFLSSLVAGNHGKDRDWKTCSYSIPVINRTSDVFVLIVVSRMFFATSGYT